MVMAARGVLERPPCGAPRCRPRAAVAQAVPGGSGRSGGQRQKQKEMLVADLRPAPAASPPARRVVPEPDAPAAAPAVAAAASAPGALAVKEPNGASGGLLPRQLQQVVAVQSSSTKALQAELSLTQAQVKQQALELRETRAALVKKEREVEELEATLAERDSKLKAARADALESKMALVAKDAELVEAYQQLSLSVQQRSALRTELTQSQTELAETRAELEQLADDILSIRELMDSFGEDVDSSDADVAAAAEARPELDAAVAHGGGAGDEGQLSGEEQGEDDALHVLQSLALLSRQLAEDSLEDEVLADRLTALERGLSASSAELHEAQAAQVAQERQ